MDAGTSPWFFCECQDPGCGLRFPAPLPLAEGACPRCGGETSCQPALPASRLHPPSRPSWPSGVRLAVLADNLRSAYNVGSILRSADGAAVSHVYLCGISPTPLHPRVGKTALGAERALPWSYHPNARRLARELLGRGARLWVLERTGAGTELFQVAPPGSGEVILAVGNEQAGVDPALVELAHRCVYLPMAGVKGSLNVASAAAVALYWMRYGPGAPRR